MEMQDASRAEWRSGGGRGLPSALVSLPRARIGVTRVVKRRGVARPFSGSAADLGRSAVGAVIRATSDSRQKSMARVTGVLLKEFLEVPGASNPFDDEKNCNNQFCV